MGNAMLGSFWRSFRPFVRWVVICTQMAFYGTRVRRYGWCCMHGRNYVKLSRVFAVQLFSMFIAHYTALPPARSDPSWPHSHAITASIRLAFTHALQHPLLATPTSAVATTTCLDYLLSTFSFPNDAPIHGLADIRLAYSQRILGVAPSTLAPRSHTAAPRGQHPLLATPTPTSAVATTTCLDYLRLHTRTVRPSTALPTYV